MERWTESLRTGELYEAEIRLRRSDGAYHWHLVRAYPMRDDAGRIRQWIGTGTDTSDAKRVQDELVKSKEQLTTLLGGIADAIIAQEPSGKMVYANDAAAKLFGLPSREALIELSNRIHASGDESSLTFFDEQGRPYPFESLPSRKARLGVEVPPVVLSFRLSNAPGKQRWVVARAKPIFDKDGWVSLVIGMTQDITELREKEEALRQLQKMESLGMLAGGIAHDFNNLLVAITGYSDLGRKMSSGQPALKEFFEEIFAAGQRASSLTQQLLAYGRKQIVQPRSLQLNDVVATMQKLLGRLIREDVDFKLNLAGGLPSVHADPSQLEQIIMNLVVNAGDAMPEGGLLVLETGYQHLDEAYVANHPGARTGPHVTLSVADTGTGMDAGVKARVFEPFYTTKEVGKGTGLGLASVYGIVNQCGGHVVVESELGSGSTFRVFLPALATAETLAVEPSHAPPPPSERRWTILLAEDEASVRRYTRMILEKQGYAVLEASNGVEAMKVAEALDQPIDLLLTDMVMPHMRGTELAERVKGLRPAIKVLLMSGYLQSGAAGKDVVTTLPIIQKPYRAEQLADSVARALNSPPSV
jgi:signal transduction histidine kinase/CheY-like chemotaxis protein